MITFGSSFITNTFIERKDKFNSYKDYKVSFVELDINSNSDCDALRSIGMGWDRGSTFALDLYDYFIMQRLCCFRNDMPQYKYYAITNNTNGVTNSDSILGVASIVEHSDGTYYIQQLQTNPEHKYGSKIRTFKKIGESLVKNILDKFPNKSFQLLATNLGVENFYKRFGFKIEPKSIYMKLSR